jgi:hypothetical protein
VKSEIFVEANVSLAIAGMADGPSAATLAGMAGAASAVTGADEPPAAT